LASDFRRIAVSQRLPLSPLAAPCASAEVAPHFGCAAQSLALARKDLAHALRRKAKRDESGPDIGDLSIFDNQAVAQLYDRNAFEADAPSLRFWKGRTVAKSARRAYGRP
jgi:hypothetical protein